MNAIAKKNMELLNKLYEGIKAPYVEEPTMLFDGSVADKKENINGALITIEANNHGVVSVEFNQLDTVELTMSDIVREVRRELLGWSQDEYNDDDEDVEDLSNFADVATEMQKDFETKEIKNEEITKMNNQKEISYMTAEEYATLEKKGHELFQLMSVMNTENPVVKSSFSKVELENYLDNLDPEEGDADDMYINSTWLRVPTVDFGTYNN